MTPSANERWMQRLLTGRGARPVGHAPPDEADGPQVPVQSPVPLRPTAPPPAEQDESEGFTEWLNAKRAERQGSQERHRGVMLIDGVPHDLPPEAFKPYEAPAPAADDRIVEWWRKDKPHLGEDSVPASAPKPQPEEGQEQDAEPPQEAVVPASPPGGPVEKVPAGTPKWTGVRLAAESASGDRRLRILAFNGTAAAFGCYLGLVDLFRGYLPYAEQAAVGTIGLVLAAGGAWTAWRACGSSAVRGVFRDKALIVRVAATVGAAEVGRRLAPVPVAYLNEYGQEWGLGPSSASLLITAVGVCGGLYWGVDRRIRHWPWAYRWLPRVPLASALLACLPYETPVL